MRLRPALIALSLLCPIAAPAQSPVYHRYGWPVIRPFRFEREIDATKEELDFRVPVLGQDGSVLYTFRAIGGSTAFLDKLGEAEGENYVGDLSFCLYEGDTPQGNSVLGYDGLPIWFTRAQVRYGDLLGASGAYPEFGRLRHFRLRGCELTVRFSDIQADAKGKVRSLRMSVSGKADPSITCSMEEPTGYLLPKTGQSKPRRGIEARQFRDQSGSWTAEKNLRGPVPCPGANPALSPDGRYMVLWAEPSAAVPQFMLLLHDRKLKNTVLLELFSEDVEVLWSPHSDHLAVREPGEEKSQDRIRIFNVRKDGIHTQLVEVPQEVRAAVEKHERVNYQIRRWVSPDALEVRASGFDDMLKGGSDLKIFQVRAGD